MCRAGQQFGLTQALKVSAHCGQSLGDVVVRVAGSQVAAAHRVVPQGGRARLPQMAVPGRQRRAQGTARVARGGLDPELLEMPVAQYLAVGDAIQRDAASQAQIGLASVGRQGAGQAQHGFLQHRLDRRGQIHVVLGQQLVGLARWATEQRVKPGAGHFQTGAIVKILLVQAKAAIGFEVDQMVKYGLGKPRLTIRRQAHQLVLARVDLEAGVVGKGRIQQAQRVRKVNFALHAQIGATADRHGGGRPFAHAVHRQYRCGVKRRGKKCRRGVALVVLGKQQARIPIDVRREF